MSDATIDSTSLGYDFVTTKLCTHFNVQNGQCRKSFFMRVNTTQSSSNQRPHSVLASAKASCRTFSNWDCSGRTTKASCQAVLCSRRDFVTLQKLHWHFQIPTASTIRDALKSEGNYKALDEFVTDELVSKWLTPAHNNECYAYELFWCTTDELVQKLAAFQQECSAVGLGAYILRLSANVHS